MLAGLFTAIALMFAPAPAEPVPLVSLDLPPGGGFGPEGCKLTIVFVQSTGVIYLNKQRIDRAKLGEALVKLDGSPGACKRIAVRANEDARYTDVLSVISLIRYNGFTAIALISEDWRADAP
ncbi:MAG: biopolymer transporter ExbD [Caulobacter sp.]|nr:biopolymer transporter ExbD [Caulobacter sp.]